MITLEHDDWMQEIYETNTVMIIQLDDGTTVYQDEGRYDQPFIERFKKYCEANNKSIHKIIIRFRSHAELAYEGSHDGIFLRRSILGSCIDERNSHYLIIGYVQNNKIYCSKWEIPEVIKKQDFNDDIREVEGNEQSIIWNTTTN